MSSPLPPKLAAAKKRQETMARKDQATPRKLVAGDGALSGGLDPTLYWNAVKNGESWEDKTFRDDMARRHPELDLRPRSGRIMVGARGEGPGLHGKMGRTKFRMYPDRNLVVDETTGEHLTISEYRARHPRKPL